VALTLLLPLLPETTLVVHLVLDMAARMAELRATLPLERALALELILTLPPSHRLRPILVLAQAALKVVEMAEIPQLPLPTAPLLRLCPQAAVQTP